MNWSWYDRLAAKKIKEVKIHENGIEALFGFTCSFLDKICAFIFLILTLISFFGFIFSPNLITIIFVLFFLYGTGVSSFGQRVCIDLQKRDIILERSLFGVAFYKKRCTLHKIDKEENVQFLYSIFKKNILYVITKDEEKILLYVESKIFSLSALLKGESFETYWNQLQEKVPDSILEETKQDQ